MNRARALLDRLWIDIPTIEGRQISSSVVFGVMLLVALAFRETVITEIALVAASVMGVVIATVFAVVHSRRRPVGPYWLVAHGITLIAFGLFRAGTGGPASLFTSLLILPVIWIASESGRRWVLVASFGTSFSIMLPYIVALEPPATATEWLRGAITPTVFGVAAAIINLRSEQTRRQLSDITELARERDVMLEEAVAFTRQLKENEGRLQAADQFTRGVLDAVTEQSVIGTNLAGLIDVWNPGAEQLLGLPPLATQGFRYVHEFHLAVELRQRAAELGVEPGLEALTSVALNGRADVRDWTYVLDDGSTVPVQLAVTPRLDRAGETVGFIFVATDITEAREVARLKDEFVSLISHELRTPLSSILGYLELLRDDDEQPLSAEQLQYLGVAERNAHRLLRLVSDLLFTAQVESGQFPLTLGEVDLRGVVSASIESARPMAGTVGVALEVDLETQPVFVRGDFVRLGQACDNLISNAIKFTPRNGTVTVVLSHAGSTAVISVTDTGIGIPASELDLLYDRFFRASTATRNAVPGVGLGLTITKAIVQAHAGSLDATSEEGIGTRFSMSIPVSSAVPVPS